MNEQGAKCLSTIQSTVFLLERAEPTGLKPTISFGKDVVEFLSANHFSHVVNTIFKN